MSLGFLAGYDETVITDIWTAIGLDQNEQRTEQRKFSSLVFDAILTYQEQISQVQAEIHFSISVISDAYATFMRSCGASKSEIASEIEQYPGESLRACLSRLKQSFDKYKGRYQEQIDVLSHLQVEASILYDQLDIPVESRSEFHEVGESDFTIARIQRFKDVIKAMQNEIGARQKTLTQVLESIRTHCAELEVPSPDIAVTAAESTDVKNSTLQELRNVQTSLTLAKEGREAELAREKTLLMKLWNSLKVPADERTQFMASFTNIGEGTVHGYASEVERLTEQRQLRLGDIIAEQQVEIQQLNAQLHCTTDPVDASNPDLNAVYDVLDAKIESKQRELAEVKGLIGMIGQRSELLQELHELVESARKVEEARAKKKEVDQKQIQKDEQAKRRIKSLLPRLEKKILVAVIEYQSAKGCDFLWEGAPYVQQLSHIKLSDTEQRQAKAPKKDAASRRTSHFPVKAPDAPQAKGPIRRSLENTKSCANNPQ
jgi:hypothetical protein